MASQESTSVGQGAVSYAVYTWEWKPGSDIGEIEKAFDEMCAMGDDVSGVQRASWGRNTAESGRGYTHVMIVIGDDKAAIDEYNLRTSRHPISEMVHGSEKSGVGIYYELGA